MTWNRNENTPSNDLARNRHAGLAVCVEEHDAAKISAL